METLTQNRDHDPRERSVAGDSARRLADLESLRPHLVRTVLDTRAMCESESAPHIGHPPLQESTAPRQRSSAGSGRARQPTGPGTEPMLLMRSICI